MLYLVVSTAGHGSSLGKLLLGIVVLEETGRPCSWLQAWKREILYFVDAFFFGLIAYSQMSKSPREQRLGDEWADTVVVHRRSAPHRSLRSGLHFAGVFFFAAFADVLALATPFAIQLART
ncbi:MAG TPA: RDD family protein [Thermoanaerobaculia bacterium]|nr:RDD family protein [Thermoanaerobaculia bacterium]